MIEIREVKSAKEIRRFIQFPLNLYKKCPYFVPPLYVDEKKMFKKNFVYNDQCEAVYFNAYKDGKIAGRISGILQLAANKKWNQKRVRFTRFDSIDDQSVANALFAAVENWAKQKGMDEVAGPLGFSDLEREGLLIEGFDELATFEEQYNYPYYQKLIENLGYEKEVDWVERQLRAPAVVDERIARLNAMMMKKYKLHLGTAKNGAEFCKKYGDRFFALLDETRFVSVILDENDNAVCFGLAIPSLAKAVRPSGGRLTPAALIRILKAVRHPKIIDLALVGVKPEYAGKGVVTTFIVAVMDMLKNHGIEYAETNLNLEDNRSIQNQWHVFDARLHKRRRAFVKKLS